MIIRDGRCVDLKHATLCEFHIYPQTQRSLLEVYINNSNHLLGGEMLIVVVGVYPKPAAMLECNIPLEPLHTISDLLNDPGVVYCLGSQRLFFIHSGAFRPITIRLNTATIYSF